MKAVFKRELRSYFNSPVGYVCVAVLTALYGFLYYLVMAAMSTSNIPAAYGYVFIFGMMAIPVLTMRSMAEERKNRTDQALLTAPVGAGSIVFGKFLACFTVYFIASTLGLLPAVVLSFFSSPSWGVILGNYVGVLLYGGAMVAIGVFISSLTESQVIAAVGTFALAIGLLLLDNLTSSVNNETVKAILEWISFRSRGDAFTQGIFSISNAVFFLSVTAVFLFLTVRRVESRRWN